MNGEWLERPVVHVSALALLALVLCLARVAGQPLDGDPAMYATIARTIARTGEWVHLTFNGVPYFNKPPLHFWMNALLFRLIEPTTFAACLLPGLLGVVDALLVYALCRATLAEWPTAFAASLVYITTPEVVHWSRGVHMETLLTFWVLIGLFAAFRSVADPRAAVLLVVAALGGWFSKGPQGLFPIAVAMALWAHAGVLPRRFLSPWTVVTSAIVVAVSGLWIWVRVEAESDFARAYFAGQIERTLFEGGILRRGPFWYLGKLLRSYWPWLPVAIVGLVMLARNWRSSLGARLWLVYSAIVLVVISVAVGKKTRYLFQLYPALAMAAGVALGAASRRVPRLPAMLLALASAAALLVATVGGERVSERRAAHVRDALEVAAALPTGRPVWLTRATQYGNPDFGKVLGFYARPLLKTCRAQCQRDLRPGAVAVARAGQARGVATRHGGTITLRNRSLAVILLPGGPVGQIRRQPEASVGQPNFR